MLGTQESPSLNRCSLHKRGWSISPSARLGISAPAPLAAPGSAEVEAAVAVWGPWLTVSLLHISVGATEVVLGMNVWSLGG